MPGTDELVKILISAEDHASKELRGVASSMDEVAKPASGLTSILGGVGKAAAGLALGGAIAGVGALGAALVSGIGDARDAAKVMAQTESAIAATGGAAGVTAQHVADLAGSLSAASGASLFGDDLIQQSSNLLLTFKNLKGPVLDAATAISVDMAQALGGAPADSAIQLGKALNDPIKGIAALSRVGVTFDAQQQKMIKTMQEHGDVAGAQAIILKELNSEFGGSAKAAAAADGGMAQFKDSLGEMAESMGRALLPMLNSFMAWLNSSAVQDGLGRIVEMVQNVSAAFQDGGLSGALSALMEELNGFAQDIGAWVVQVAPQIAAQLLAWGQAFIDWVAPMIPLALAALGDLIVQLGAWIVAQVPVLVGQLAAWGQAFIDWIAPMIPPALAKLADIASGLIAWIGEQAPPILAKLSDWANAFVAWIVPATVDFLNKWPAFLSQFLDWIGSAAGPLLLKLGDWAVQFLAWIIPMIPGFLLALGAISLALLKFIGETVLVLVPKLLEWAAAFVNWIATDAIPKLVPALGKMLDTIGGWISDTAGPWIVEHAKALGESLVNGAQTGLRNLATTLNTAVTDVFTAAMTLAQNIVNGAVENILGFITHAIQRIQALIDWIGRIPSIHVPTPSTPPDTGGKSGFQSAGVPSFASGVTNFGGGLALVHAGELLMNLSRGTSVIPAGSGGAVFNIVVNAPSGDGQAIANTLVSTLRSRGVR